MKTTIYYSNDGGPANPETSLGPDNGINIMLTFWDCYVREKPTKRFLRVLKTRKGKKIRIKSKRRKTS